MSSIQIADRSTGDIVDAELVADVSLDELVRTEAQFREFRKRRIAEAVSKSHALPESSEWDWGLKGSDNSGSYRYFGIRHKGKMQGLAAVPARTGNNSCTSNSLRPRLGIRVHFHGYLVATEA
jgi:hypothetical protein